MKKLILASILSLSFFTASQAQTQKIGFLNMNKILDSIPQMDTLRTAYLEYRDAVQMQLESGKSDIQKYQQEYESLQNQAQTVQVQQKLANLESMLNSMIQNYQLNQQNAQQDLEYYQMVLLQPINDYIKAQVADISKKRGYTHVISSDPSTLFYAANENDDLSDQIIMIMKKNAPKVKPTVKSPALKP